MTKTKYKVKRPPSRIKRTLTMTGALDEAIAAMARRTGRTKSGLVEWALMRVPEIRGQVVEAGR